MHLSALCVQKHNKRLERGRKELSLKEYVVISEGFCVFLLSWHNQHLWLKFVTTFKQCFGRKCEVCKCGSQGHSFNQ